MKLVNKIRTHVSHNRAVYIDRTIYIVGTAAVLIQAANVYRIVKKIPSV